jgi:hypothetical protein
MGQHYVHIVELILLCMFFQGGFDPEQSTVFNFRCGTELNYRDCLFWRFYRKNLYGDNSLVKELASHIV